MTFETSVLVLLGVCALSHRAPAQVGPQRKTIGVVPGAATWVGAAPGAHRLYYSTAGGNSLYLLDRQTQRTTLVITGELLRPSISPRGNRIAFARGSEDGSRRHVWDLPLDPRTGLAAGPPRRLSLSWGDNPAFSHDGKWIAFASRDSRNAQSVKVIAASGGRERGVARVTGFVNQIAWSSDGKSLFFSHAPVRFQSGGGETFLDVIERADVAGGAVHRVLGAALNRPGISPDGRALVVQGRGLSSEMIIANASGSERSTFFLPPNLRVGLWTSANAFLAYRVGRLTSLRSVSLVDSSTRQLTDSTAYADRPSWSPDGRHVAFIESLAAPTLWVMNADGSGRRHITLKHEYAEYLNNLRGYTWSPDGQWIAYTGTINDRPRYIGVVELRTGRETAIANDTEIRGFLVWTAASNTLIYDRILDSVASPSVEWHHEVHTVSIPGVQDKVARRLTTPCPHCVTAFQDSLVYYGRHGGTAITTLQPNAPSRFLFKNDSTIRRSGGISEDGRWSSSVYDDPDAPGQWVADIVASDGSEHQRVKLRVIPVFGAGAWWFSRDSRRVMFVGREPLDQTPGVYVITRATGETRKIASMEGAGTRQNGYSFSPDGTRLVYVAAGDAATTIFEIHPPQVPRRLPTDRR